MAMIFLLLVAGFETTTHLISDSIIALGGARNPAQKAWLLADPVDRMERAVEELARFTTPVQSTKPRYVSPAITVFFGQPLKRGDLILAYVSAANAEPGGCSKSQQALQLDRFPNPHPGVLPESHPLLPGDAASSSRSRSRDALGRLYARYPDLQSPPARTAGVDGATRPARPVKRLPVRLSRQPERLAA